jgi:hypothetical protein
LKVKLVTCFKTSEVNPEVITRRMKNEEMEEVLLEAVTAVKTVKGSYSSYNCFFCYKSVTNRFLHV